MYLKWYPSLYHDVREEGGRGEGSGSCELIASERKCWVGVGGWVVGALSLRPEEGVLCVSGWGREFKVTQIE